LVLTTETGRASPVLTTLRVLIVCKFSVTEAAVLVRECFPNFDVYLQMEEKDISNIADDYSKRTNAQSRIIFGFCRINELKGLMYWAHDMKRMNINPEDQDIASADIQLAIEKTDIRKIWFDNMETSSKAAAIGNIPHVQLSLDIYLLG
jgi:hypothetical protein